MIDEEELYNRSPSELAGMFHVIKNQRLEARRAMMELQEDETLLKQALIRSLGDQEGIVLQGNAFRSVEKQRPYISDFPRLKDYILDTGHLQVLNRSLNAKALSELSDVPGIEVYTYCDISIKKVSK